MRLLCNLKKDTQIGFGDGILYIYVKVYKITQFIPLPKVFMQCQCYIYFVLWSEFVGGFNYGYVLCLF